MLTHAGADALWLLLLALAVANFGPIGALWVPMRQHRDDEEVDFAIVGTGAGGGTLACQLSERGFSVVAFDAGPYFRPLEDFASDESNQSKL